MKYEASHLSLPTHDVTEKVCDTTLNVNQVSKAPLLYVPLIAIARD